METKTIIGLVAAVVVVGGGVWYFSSGNSANAPTTEEGVATTMEGEEQADGSGTLADLMMRAGSFRCDVDVAAEEGNTTAETSGVVYIGDGKMRGDFTTKVSGMTVNSHMLTLDGYVYTWSDMMPQGMKMKVAADGTAQGQTQGSMDASAAVDYHCAPWSVDGARFTIPSSVTFMTVGS